MRTTLLLFLAGFSWLAHAQTTYVDSRGNTHRCGPFELSVLETDTLFADWYAENYTTFAMWEGATDWKAALEGMEVDVYLGTWCGDSKRWVPQFVALWDALGLDRDQLHFVALYNGTDQYKQGPNGEEKGLNIHRVPTFIFKEAGEEVARIVESPANDLVTDVAQIALGVPSQPNYRGATYTQNMLAHYSQQEIYDNYREHVNAVYRLVKGTRELNTLGYVYLRAGEVEKALMTFEMNTYFYPYDPNVFDSYGEALALAERNEEAAAQYEKVLALDPENTNAQEQLAKLR
ncbi:MAG TPA: hypothetical protein DCR93_09550 [Cytophagales bacterium]|nr:hypothetical protein [Cytophagales bacterium]